MKTAHLLGFDLSPVIENTIYGAKFTYCSKDPFIIESADPIAFLVMRDRFDQLLVDKALESGAALLDGEKVTRVEEKDGGVEVESGKARRLRMPISHRRGWAGQYRCQVFAPAAGEKPREWNCSRK